MPERILITNSSASFLPLIAEILHEDHYETHVICHGLEQLDAIAALRPDLIIIDADLDAEGAAWELVQNLRLRKPTTEVPLLVLCFPEQLFYRRQTELIAMNIAILTKPFDIGQLLQRVRQTLDESQRYQNAAPQHEEASA